jgi:ATP-dependent Lon protease
VKLIDNVRAKLDAKNDCYVAELPSLTLKDVQIADTLVQEHERMLTDGFYAEVTLEYDPGGGPGEVRKALPDCGASAHPDVQSSGPRDAWRRPPRLHPRRVEGLPDPLRGARALGPDDRAKAVVLLRMVPFVERNYNLVELGPRGTGKSHSISRSPPIPT